MKVIHQSDRYRLSAREDTGLFTFEFSGHATLENYTCAVEYSFGDAPPVVATMDRTPTAFDPSSNSYVMLRGEDGPKITARFTPTDENCLIDIEIENRGDKPIRIYNIYPLYPAAAGSRLSLGGKIGMWRFFKNGFSVLEPSRAVPFNASESSLTPRLPWFLLPKFFKYMVYNSDYKPGRVKGRISSEWFTTLGPISGGFALAIGFAGFTRHFSKIELDWKSSSIKARATCDGVRIPSGKTWSAEKLFIGSAEEASIALNDYAIVAAAGANPRFYNTNIWCTWYSGKYNKINEQYVMDNLRGMKNYRGKIEYAQVDDGYQKSFGEWTIANKKFPSGLSDLARRIEEKGFRPGLWTAPFCISKSSPIFKEHPDWLLKDAKGKPIIAGVIAGILAFRPYYALDCTNPEALEWLEATFRRLAGMGFDIFKIDFLTATTIGEHRYDPEFTRAESYNRGLKAIRSGIGDQKVLLTAISPWMANMGLADIVRISPDSAFGKPTWAPLRQRLLRDEITPGMKNATRNIINRAFVHNIFWTSDPDAVFERNLSESEVRSQHTAALILGSANTIGNNFIRYPFRFLHIEELMKYVKKRVMIFDLLERDIPEEIVVEAEREGKKFFLYALFNWSGRRRAKTVNIQRFLPTYHLLDNKEVFDYWERRMKRFEPGQEIDLAPHDCKLFIVPSGKE